jgi:hypothetical protein
LDKWKEKAFVKRNDIILIGVLLIIAAGAFFYFNNNRKEGDKVVVTIDGKFYKEFPLDKDIETDIEVPGGGSNHLVIEKGYADITAASCPDELCVHQKSIHSDKESIICLPNKVVVEVKGDTESELDGVAN